MLAAGVATEAAATSVYEYSGHHFELYLNNTPLVGTYNGSMRVSGWLTLSDPLPDDSPLTDVTHLLLDWAFQDG